MNKRDLSAELMSCETASTSSPTVFNILNAWALCAPRLSAPFSPPKLMLDPLQAMQLAQLDVSASSSASTRSIGA